MDRCSVAWRAATSRVVSRSSRTGGTLYRALRRLKGKLSWEGRHRGVEVGPHHTLMIVVDSSTCADFFNGASTPHVERLDVALHEEEDLAVPPIIITEVPQGLERVDRSYEV